MEKTERKFSKDGSIHVTDEKINTITHVLGFMFAVLGTAFLIVNSSIQGEPWKIVSFSIYGTFLILMYLASSLHHGINGKPKTESVFRFADYLAIFPLIAGTYTPICLIILRDATGWTIFGVVWALAIISIVIKSVFPNIPKWAIHTFYVGLGWIGFVLVIPVYRLLGLIPVLLIALGGVFYTIGALIYYIEKPNPIKGKFGFHEIWHIFVILGTLSHYFFMYFFALHY